MKALLLSAMLAVQAWGQDPNNWFNSGTTRQVYVRHKAAHAIGGMLITWAFHEMGYPKTGLAFTMLLGILKERYDQLHGGSFRVGDIAWTVGPAYTIYVVFKW